MGVRFRLKLLVVVLVLLLLVAQADRVQGPMQNRRVLHYQVQQTLMWSSEQQYLLAITEMTAIVMVLIFPRLSAGLRGACKVAVLQAAQEDSHLIV